MTALFSWLLANPLMILAMIGVFTFTSIGADVKAWIAQRHAVQGAVKPWIEAVAERDQAAAKKEAILNEAIQSKLDAEQAVLQLQSQFDEEDAKRQLTAAPANCTWSDDDIRLLNGARPRKASAPDKGR